MGKLASNTELERSLVDSQNSAIHWASVLHILYAVYTEGDEGTAGTQEEAEYGSHDECEAPVLVGDVGGDFVAIGTSDYHWSWPKHNLHKSEEHHQ